MTKLHLGCGQRYINGYINIDYPSSEHTVQNTSVADKHADITKLKYKKNSISEIRLHHVFEHFSRAQAAALIFSWRSWLEDNGILRIEVPDFRKTAKSVFSPFTSRKVKNIGLRHIFGSQEANWATHYHGWDKNELMVILESSGYMIKKVKTIKWNGMYNIEVFAGKNGQNISKRKSRKLINNWLSRYMVDNSSTEKEMLKTWTTESNQQLENSWGE